MTRATHCTDHAQTSTTVSGRPSSVDILSVCANGARTERFANSQISTVYSVYCNSSLHPSIRRFVPPLKPSRRRTGYTGVHALRPWSRGCLLWPQRQMMPGLASTGLTAWSWGTIATTLIPYANDVSVHMGQTTVDSD